MRVKELENLLKMYLLHLWEKIGQANIQNKVKKKLQVKIKKRNIKVFPKKRSLLVRIKKIKRTVKILMKVQ